LIWEKAISRTDERARDIADRHYNRQSIGNPHFTPPGRCLVLYTETTAGKAFWVTSFPFAEYVRHAWAGAWVCSAFRNEGAGTASEMITDALKATRAHFGEPPPLGMVTFIDRLKVKPIKRRGIQYWGYTYEIAGFRHVGETKGGLLAFQILPENIPQAEEAKPAPNAQLSLFDFEP